MQVSPKGDGIELALQSGRQEPSDCCTWAGWQPQLPSTCGDWLGGQQTYLLVMLLPGGQQEFVCAFKAPPPGHVLMNDCAGRQLPFGCGTCPTGQHAPVYTRYGGSFGDGE